jgi:hypothetical protein
MRCRGTVAEGQRQRDRCGEPQRQGQSDRDPKKPGALSVSAVSEVYCPRAERNIQRQRQERESARAIEQAFYEALASARELDEALNFETMRFYLSPGDFASHRQDTGWVGGWGGGSIQGGGRGVRVYGRGGFEAAGSWGQDTGWQGGGWRGRGRGRGRAGMLRGHNSRGDAWAGGDDEWGGHGGGEEADPWKLAQFAAADAGS